MGKNTKVSVSVRIDVAACLRVLAAIVYFLT